MKSAPEHKCKDACDGLDDDAHDELVRAEREEWRAGYADHLYDMRKHGDF